ncbi:MAG: Helix-turn-helix domain protein [Smithella sp. PtaU1.Bin162]|nr:MAG: Helix-turn-helix domain protein [Smithella sp. PtaU1.Bin162]
MQISQKIKPEIIAGAVGLLQPYMPQLSAQGLVNALASFENTEDKKDTLETFLTPRQAAEALQVSKPTLYRLIHENKISLIKATKRLSRIPAAAIREYLANGGYSGGRV